MTDLARHYEGWSGTRTGYGTRMRFFVREGVFSTLRSKWALAIVLITYGLVVVPRVFEALMLQTAFDPNYYVPLFLDAQILILLFAAVAGAGIIADDLKDGSIVLHVTRRLGARGYLFGRLATLVVSLSVLTLLPFVLLMIIAVLSTSGTGIEDGGRVIVAGLAAGSLLSVFFTVVVAALSAMLRDSRYAGAGVFFFVLFSDIAASIMESLSSDVHARLISVGDNLQMTISWLFGISPPHAYSAGYSAAILGGIMALCSFLLVREMLVKEGA